MFLCAIGPSAVPAQPEGEPFRDAVDVDLVEIDVFVEDRKGSPIRGLKPGDFELYVDGRPVKVSNFFEHRPSGTPGPPSDWVTTEDGRPGATPGREGQVPLTVVLYMDDLNTHPAHRQRLLRRFAETVEPLRRVDARFMLAAFDEHMKIVLSPTRDLDALLEAAADRPKLLKGPRLLQLGRRKAMRDMVASDRDCREMGRAASGVGARGCLPCVDNWGQLMSIARSFATDELARVHTAMDGLADLVTTLGGVHGRKAVVHVSSGLPQQSGLSVFTYLVEQVCPATDSTFMRNASEATMAATGFNQASRFNLVTAHANANRVTIFPVDAAGLRTPTGDISLAGEGLTFGDRAEPSARNDLLFVTNAQDGLFLLAEETGGKALVNSNDLTELMDDVALELSSGYSLGFLLTDRRPGQVRQVEVRLAAAAKARHRRIRYRRSFRDKPLEERLAERLLSVAHLGGEENPLGAVLHFLPSESPGRKLHGLSVGVTVPKEAATLVPGPDGTPPRGALRLWLVAVDDEKGTRTTVRQRGVRVGGGGVTATAGAFRFEVDLTLPEGDYAVAVGVRNETTGAVSLLRSAVSVPLETPD